MSSVREGFQNNRTNLNFLLKFKGVSGIIVGFKGTILLGEHLKKTQNFRHNMSKLGQPDVISTLIWTKISLDKYSSVDLA